MSNSPQQGIAIVGLAGRFPGAQDAAELWRRLAAGEDCLTRFTDEELRASGYDPAFMRKLPGYVATRGVIENAEYFDRGFFGISHREAEAIDPQQRVFLEVAWAALEDAGCDPSRYPGLIGVFAGMSNNTYLPFFLRQRPDLLQAVGVVNACLGNEKDFLTTRLAHKLNLRGPALNIQTACSSSLVAVSIACAQLRDRQCDVALAGGVSITLPQQRGYYAQEGGMNSTDGWCRPFDRRANGTVFAHGAALVVLKRMEDAVAEGDQIYAVIRGHATNNDGAQKLSFAAPSVAGQAEVIALAQAVAGVSAESISYLEAHGTATPLGDPIEVRGLAQVFGAATARRGFCALSSIKGNLGHMDAASGTASLIKTALALRKEAIPPTIHCEEPNPELHLEETAFFLNRELRPWPRGEQPRRAGVSSLGVGGTNAHVVLEEAPLLPVAGGARRTQLLVLSAKTATALERRAADLAAHLESHPEEPLAAVAFTLGAGRQRFAHRRAVAAGSGAAAAEALRDVPALHRTDERQATPVAFLFPGQGSQYRGMARGLLAGEPAFRTALEECAAAIGVTAEALLESEQLDEARFAQPAIFAVDYALGRYWLSLGVEPAVLAGHSVGEFAAATLAGVFTPAEAMRLVARRAELVQALPRGAMLAVRISEAEAAAFLSADVSLAAVNSPRLCVLSGTVVGIEAVEATCRERGVPARRLGSSHAFHSAMVEPIVPEFLAAVQAVRLRAPERAIISTVTGALLTAEEATDPAYWARHLRATVRFADALGTLLAQHEGVLLEVGAGAGLTQLGRQHGGKKPHHEFTHSLAEESEDGEAIARALSRLWLCGVPLAWERVTGSERPRKVSLPAYPFERQRYFADLPAGVAMPLATAATDGDVPIEVSLAPVVAATVAAAQTVAAVAAAPTLSPVLDRLRAMLTELSGEDFSAAPAEANLLELGFDSLFLSQVAITVSRRFGTRVAFRQLLKELGTLASLARHLEGAAEVTVPAPAMPIAGTAASPAAHGPFKPVRRELEAGLTSAQEQWLRGFIARYVERTAGSKARTQEFRGILADPRAVSGFKGIWKEMVYPIVADRSAGAYLWDIDGRKWNDITLSFGAAMFGHRPDFVVRAIEAQLARGMEIGPTSPLAGEVAALLCEITGHERVTFCNTGSEAMSGAVRAARTATGRPKIAYFSGSYHGITDEVLGRRAGTGAMPIAPGIPAEALAQAVILEYGSPEALAQIAALGSELAAVLVEPVQSRRPDFQPAEFLRELRAVTAKHGIALIFDEVITGFRGHPGGAQAHFGVKADLATYGKVLGGGIPIGAIAGKAEYMDAFDGGGWQFGDDSFPGAAMTFFAGTFVRHPLALAAARAVLQHVKTGGAAMLSELSARTDEMMERLAPILAGTPFTLPRFGSSWLLVTDPAFPFPGLLQAVLRYHGLHVWDNRPCFLSTAHTEADIDEIVHVFEQAIAELRGAGFFGATIALAEPEADRLSEGQRELWTLCQLSPLSSAACNESWLLHLEGPFQPAALTAAVQGIVARHPSLRTSFEPSGERVKIAPALVLDFPLHDLSRLSDDERETRLTSLKQGESGHVFTLEQAPLIRLQLLRYSPEHHALLFNAHHLVCDGWSCDIFLRELAALYSAKVEHGAAALPPPGSPSAWQAWEEQLHGTPDFAADAAYWRERFRTLPPPLDLPGNRPRPRVREDHGASEIVILPAELPRRLQQAGAKHGATLFSVLLTGFQVLLQELSGQRDLVVGVPSAGQSLAGQEELIGHCVNLLPLRLQGVAGEDFTTLLARTQGEVMEAFEHRTVTFGWLLKQLTLPRDPARMPLVSTTFNLDPPHGELRFAGLRYHMEPVPRSAFQFDLGINCDSFAGGFRIICHYNTELFDAETIRIWLTRFRAILDAFAPPAVETLCLWPSSTSAGGDPAYDDVLYNAMTLDRSRHEAYRRAFAKIVPGKIVVDIGTGRDALLARMCLEAGAKKVYAIELLERPAQQARETVARLGLSDRIIVLQGRSEEVSLPERADVAVSENVGHIGGAEGCDLILVDARARFLKPDGVVIPGRCRTLFAAVSLPEGFLANPTFDAMGGYYAGEAWRQAGYPHDFRLCLMGANRSVLSSTVGVFEEIDFAAEPKLAGEQMATLQVTRPGRIDGFLLWLELETAAGVSLEALDHADSWLPVYLPVFDPALVVQAGESIALTVRSEFAPNHHNRDYFLRGTVGARSFAFDSWHYRQVFREAPFYRRLFEGGRVPISGETLAPTQAAAPAESLIFGALPDYPADEGVHEVFARVAARQPGKVAIVDGAESITYGALERKAATLAAQLATMGVRPGQKVGLCFERSIRNVAAMLAVLRAGGAYVPLDGALPAERLAGMVQDSGVSLVLGGTHVAWPAGVRAVDPDSLPATEPGEPVRSADPGGALAYVMFTSGSTGRPKGAQITHRGISRLVINSDAFEFEANDVVAHLSNVAFDASTLEIFGALLNGGRLQIIPAGEALEPLTFLATLRRQGVTMMLLTAALFQQVAKLAPGEFGFLRLLASGGDALNPAAARAVLQSGTPPRILLNAYGPTEIAVACAGYRVREVEDGARSVPIGHAMSNNQLYVLDAGRKPVAVGEKGELYVGGPGVAAGYAGRPEQTEASFPPDPFAGTPGARMYKTGDLVRLRADGELEFLGRIDEQVKIRGYRVEPAEIEAALLAHPQVGQSKVRAHQRPDSGKTLIGYVSARNGVKPQPEDLRRFLQSRLPEYSVPSSFVVVESWPLTPNGKIDTAALPLPGRTPAEVRPAARSETENVLAALWTDALGTAPASLTQDFFVAGGHSLLAIQLIGRIRERFQVSVPVRQLFETPTIKGLAAWIDEHRPAEEIFQGEHLVPMQKGERDRAPLFVIPGGTGRAPELLALIGLVREIGPEQPVYGLKVRETDGKAFPQANTESIAAAYLREVRQVQAHGPYALAGECVGGVIAYEMARQLEAAGEEVALLAVLDATWPEAWVRRWFLHRQPIHRRLEHWLGRWDARVRQPFREHVTKLAPLSWGQKFRYLWERKARLLPPAPGTPRPEFTQEQNDYLRSVMSTAPQLYHGPVALLVASTLSRDHGALGWDKGHPGPLEVHVLPGDHYTYIREHAASSGAKLRELLARPAAQPVCI